MNKDNAGGSNFLVSIYHQENHSYQGTIQWLDTGKSLHFRSELELLNLIHEAVVIQTETNEIRSWSDAKAYRVI